MYIRYRVESLDGFSGTSGINPCSSMLMAAAGVSAGAEWDVYPGDSIQGAIDGAGDTIYVHEGTNAREC